jgi:hypothetical protein
VAPFLMQARPTLLQLVSQRGMSAAVTMSSAWLDQDRPGWPQE